MKTIKNYLLAFMVAFGMTVSANQAQAAVLKDYLEENDIDISVSATLDYYSKYVWRGFLLDDDMVIQPGVTISSMGFEGGFWGSFDLQNDDPLASDEVDGWIGYGTDLGFISEELDIVSVSVGNTWYHFPGGDTYTSELYLGVAVDTILSPSFTWYYDYGEEASGGADGSYYIFSIGHSLDVNEEYGITLDLGAELSLNDGAFIVGEGGHFGFSAGLTIPVTETFTVAPVLAYSTPFGDLEDASDGNQEDHFYGGVSLAFDY